MIDRPDVLEAKMAFGAEVGRDLAVQVVLPVHALGDRLDDEVAAGEQLEVLLVVGRRDLRGQLGMAERRRIELLQPLDGLLRDPVLRAFLRRQVEEDRRHAGVDQVGGDLRAHDAGAEDGDLPDDEIAHDFLHVLHALSGRAPGRAGLRQPRGRARIQGLLLADPGLGAAEERDADEAADLELACRRPPASPSRGRPCPCSDRGSRRPPSHCRCASIR